MTRFRNVRVKMRGGKSRLQRAMVLASGKLRFVKNVRRSSSPSRASSPRHQTRRTSNMARKKRHGSRGSLLKSAEQIGQAAALLAPHVDAFILKKDTNLGLYRLSGYHMATQKWHWDGLIQGWGPVVGFTVAAKVFHKINSMLRRV